MRIIGGHDYYDSGMQWGQDTGVLFVRGSDTLTPNEIEGLGIPCLAFAGTLRAKKSRSTPRDLVISTTHVILCGKMYSGLRVRFGSYAPYFTNPLHGEFWFWDLASLEAWAGQRDLEIVADGNVGRRWSWTHHHDNVTFVEPTDYFGPKALPKAALDNIVERRKTIISYAPGDYDYQQRKHVWRVDQDSLQKIQFFRAVGHNTAFQEISMWIGGVLGAVPKDAIEITDDKVKIQKKGFDLRSSFRRMKAFAA
jgi:hypothetical protein